MSVGAEYGGRGAKGAERVLADVNTLFAGGEMADEDLVAEARLMTVTTTRLSV